MFFVLGTGRCGTKFIAELLSSVQGCICLHEPAPELILESSAYRYGTIAQSDIAEIFRNSRNSTIDGSVYCEANQTLSLIIPVLSKVFPEARYIWLIRNGLDFVASAYQKQWYTGHSENHDRYEDCPPLEKMWIDGRVQGDRSGDMSDDEWGEMDRFARCCWYWKYVNGIIEKDLKEYCPDRFFNIRLEDIKERLPNLLQWMGMDSQKVHSINRSNIAKRIPYHWTDWSEEHRQIFEHWCGDLMDQFYPDWRVHTDEKARFFVLPAMHGLKQKVQNLSSESDKLRVTLKEQTEKLKRSEKEVMRCKGELQESNNQIKRLVAEKNALESHLMAIKISLSWKITKPLRNAKDLVRRLRS